MKCSFRTLMPLFFFLIIAVFPACKETYIGEGEVIEQDRTLDKFDKVALNMNAVVEVTDTLSGYCRVIAQGNIQEAIVTRVDGNTLVITSRGNLVTDKPVTILIGISQAAAFEVNGTGIMKARNTIKNEEFDFEVNGSGKLIMELIAAKTTGAVSGSGEVRLTGSSNDFKVEINGSGVVDAEKFSTLSAKARISGSGEVKLFTEETLEARVQGSGVVSYHGNPVVEKEISGSGAVNKLD